MTLRGDSVLDTQGFRPGSAAVSAAAGAVVGLTNFVGLLYLTLALFDSTGSVLWRSIVAGLAVVQVVSGVLLFVGAARISVGAGRGMVVAGCVLEFPVCAAYGWFALDVLAGDPQDGQLFGLFFGVSCGVAVVTACCLFLALRPSVAEYVSLVRGLPA
jgi:hypothetical protein